MTTLNEWGYTPDQWAALPYTKRYYIKNRERENARSREHARRKRLSMTPEQKAEANRQRVEYNRRWRADLTEAEREEKNAKRRTAEQRERHAQRMRERRAAMTPEQREEDNRKARERMTRHYAAMTAEERRRRFDRINADKRRRNAVKRAEREAIKVAQEAARKALIPARRKENRAAFDKNPAGLYARIRRAVPRSFPADVRDDIATDISIALLDGEIALDEIETSVSQFLSKHYQGRGWHKNISFDQPIAGTNDLRLGDTIAADAFHF